MLYIVDVIPKDKNLYYIYYIFGVIQKNKYSLLWYESAKFHQNYCSKFIRISAIKRDDRRAQSARMNANID